MTAPLEEEEEGEERERERERDQKEVTKATRRKRAKTAKFAVLPQVPLEELRTREAEWYDSEDELHDLTN